MRKGPFSVSMIFSKSPSRLATGQEAAPALLTGRAEAPAAGALILGRVSI